MANLPLTSADWPEVRAAIDVSLDATVLPDAVISLSIYQTAGEQDVIRQDPNYNTYSAGSDQAKAIHRAAVYYIAARLAIAVPRLLREQFGQDYQYTRADAPDWAAVAAQLVGLADGEMATVLTSGALTLPTLFTVASGCRGR